MISRGALGKVHPRSYMKLFCFNYSQTNPHRQLDIWRIQTDIHILVVEILYAKSPYVKRNIKQPRHPLLEGSHFEVYSFLSILHQDYLVRGNLNFSPSSITSRGGLVRWGWSPIKSWPILTYNFFPNGLLTAPCNSDAVFHNVIQETN